jgi:hypothetical protein
MNCLEDLEDAVKETLGEHYNENKNQEKQFISNLPYRMVL